MIPPIYPTLSASAPVTALIGSGSACRCYPFAEAPVGVSSPYVTWQLVSGLPTSKLAGGSVFDNLRVQVDCWATTGKSTANLAEAVRVALEAVSVCVSINLTERDQETKLYRYSMDFEFIDPR